MSSDTEPKPKLKYTKELIEMRRAKVLELLSKGKSGVDISQQLNVSTALISQDIAFLKQQAKDSLKTHIQDRLPFEFARAFAGINDILRRAHEILDSTKDPKLQHQYMTLIMQLWGQVISMATDGGVIEQAFKKVESISAKDFAQTEKEEEPISSRNREKIEEEDLEAEEAEEE